MGICLLQLCANAEEIVVLLMSWRSVPVLQKHGVNEHEDPATKTGRPHN